MKTYKIDDNLVHRDKQSNFSYREVVSIIHYETTDDAIKTEAAEWTADKALLELTVVVALYLGFQVWN